VASESEPVRIEGLGQLMRALKVAEGNVDDLKEANQAAANIVLAAARPRAPRRRGALAGSGRVNRAAKKANVIFGRASVPYANPIHWGWRRRNIKAQPFAMDAANATRSMWMGAYERALRDLTDDIERSTS